MDLKELLGEELFKQVSEKLGDKKLIVNDGSYIPIDKFNQKNEEVKLLKEKLTLSEKQIADTTDLIKKHEEANKGNDELKNKLAELQQQNLNIQEEAKKQLEAKDIEITNIQKKTALVNSLKEAGCMHPDLLLNKFELDKLTFEGDTIKGIDDNLKVVKEKYATMFQPAVQPQGGSNPASGVSSKTQIQTLQEQYQKAQQEGKTTEAVRLYDQIFAMQTNK